MKNIRLTAFACLMFICGAITHYGWTTNGMLPVRAKVLENSTVTYVWLNDEQYSTLKDKDTVWIDLAKHEVNDTAENTMMGVLIFNDKK